MNKQFYGVKYPFTTLDDENYFFDLNRNMKDRVRSILMHVIFTPKGQKLRDPEFGSNLIQYIFEPNDGLSWEGLKSEINSMLRKYVSNVNINDISVIQDENEFSSIIVKVDYTVTNGYESVNDTIVTKL